MIGLISIKLGDIWDRRYTYENRSAIIPKNILGNRVARYSVFKNGLRKSSQAMNGKDNCAGWMCRAHKAYRSCLAAGYGGTKNRSREMTEERERAASAKELCAACGY